MIKIGSKVKVGSSKVEGTVVLLEIPTGSILVAHKIMVDGRSKDVEQWYNQNAAEEVIEGISAEELDKKVSEITASAKESVKKMKTVVERIKKSTEEDKSKKIEFGVLPEKSDSDGK
jgi:predicted transcriptional regulator